jgi:hypothetical protein
MKRSQADLKKRLHGIPPNDRTFTAVQMRATLKQVETVLQMTKRDLLGTVVGASNVVATNSAKATVSYLNHAEAKFRGVAGEGLGIRTAAVLDPAVSGANASVLRRIAGDPDHPGNPGVIERYGEGVIGHFERTLQTSLVAGTPWDDVRSQLVTGSPFLQAAPQYWAERIVRTELMGAHNVAGNNALLEINEQTGGQMLRILCATFDDRTGADSYAVHGQIRRMTEPFASWFGSYMTPPNRPNDREIIVPHHIEWPIPENLKQKTDSEIAQRWAMEGRKGSPPGRPLMTTVPVELIGKPAPSVAQEQTPAPQPVAAPVPPPAQGRPSIAAATVARTIAGEPGATRQPSSLELGRERLRAAMAAEEQAQIAARQATEARRAVEAETRQARQVETVVANLDRLQATIREAGIAESRATVKAKAAKTTVVEAKVPAKYIEAAQAAVATVDPTAKRTTGEPPIAKRIPIGEQHSLSFEAANGFEVTVNQGPTQINDGSQVVFGRSFDARDFSGVLGLHELSGVEIQDAQIRAYHYTDASKFFMSAKIVDPNTGKTGSLSRSYTRTSDGKLSVGHNLFTLPDSLKDGGMGSRMIESQFATYRKLGVDVVETHAAWDGQYVWPSMGFELQNPNQLGAFKQEFSRWAQGTRKQVNKVGEVMKEPATPEPISTTDLIGIIKDVKSIQELAALEFNGIAVGKEFLRSHGYSEMGLINLELNLKSPETLARLDEYTATRAKERAAKKAAMKVGATDDQARLAAKIVVRGAKNPDVPKEITTPPARTPRSRGPLVSRFAVGDTVSYVVTRSGRSHVITGSVEGFTPTRVRVRIPPGRTVMIDAELLSRPG